MNSDKPSELLFVPADGTNIFQIPVQDVQHGASLQLSSSPFANQLSQELAATNNLAPDENPCLHLVINRLSIPGGEHFAIWVRNVPYPSGYAHYDCVWTETLTQLWLAWQEMFSSRGLPYVPQVHHATQSAGILSPGFLPSTNGRTTGYGSELMQQLGTHLWQWLFGGSIQRSLDQSQGIAMGQNKPLRLRLEIRDPDLIALPWEIMQPQRGQTVNALSQRILFSRTSSDVESLPRTGRTGAAGINILLVLGHDPGRDEISGDSINTSALQLKEEAEALAQLLKSCEQAAQSGEHASSPVKCRVDTLVQPTPAELISRLETQLYNILFYAGHGAPAADGGVLFLRPDRILSGTELAQVLVRCRVTLCVLNACWGAQPYLQQNQRSLPRSSLAEVLLHHGVPAVLAMRDSIADDEALSFIQAFAQALALRKPIDEAVAEARQQLLVLYKFNQPAWTLPVLYMHPEFDGELIIPISTTDVPTHVPSESRQAIAFLRLKGTKEVWSIRGRVMRVGRLQDKNDIEISDQWASQKHAEIICRGSMTDESVEPTYFLRDYSRNGTLMLGSDGSWQEIYHQEVPLLSGTLLKFGSRKAQSYEFIIESSNESVGKGN